MHNLVQANQLNNLHKQALLLLESAHFKIRHNEPGKTLLLVRNLVLVLLLHSIE
jgi:hypothetical protein